MREYLDNLTGLNNEQARIYNKCIDKDLSEEEFIKSSQEYENIGKEIEKAMKEKEEIRRENDEMRKEEEERIPRRSFKNKKIKKIKN